MRLLVAATGMRSGFQTQHVIGPLSSFFACPERSCPSELLIFHGRSEFLQFVAKKLNPHKNGGGKRVTVSPASQTGSRLSAAEQGFRCVFPFPRDIPS
jgi:hypothetical protein